MEKPSKINEIIEKIKVEKELLSTMPRNNTKNKAKYEEKLNEIIEEYEKEKNKIIKELTDRYNNELEIEENKEIKNLETRIKTIENILYLFNEDRDSFEKIGLDKNIYKIGKFYKDNFENINIQILECINKFKKVEIYLTEEDFEYSIYVKQYMEVFFKELPNTNSDKLKEKFEELYWKCPDIIIHIELNIRNLYFKYKIQIDKHIEQIKNELLKKWEKTPKGIIKSYQDLVIKKDNEEKINKKQIVEEFISGKKQTKNYESNKIIKDLKGIYQEEKIDKTEEVEENVYKFLKSLYEYENYMEFKFIVDDMKKYYEEKDQYKKSYLETKKQIDQKEKKIFALNKKITKPGLFGKKKNNTNQLVEQNNLILEVEELYKELDLNNCYTKIANILKDDSSLYDTLKLASSCYYYLITLIIKNEEDIEPEMIDEKIERLEKFLISPYINIINNITILEDKDIAMIIKDRYKLSNFILEKEDLDIDNVDSLITTLTKIDEYFNMKKMGIETEKIKELLEIKKLLKL